MGFDITLLWNFPIGILRLVTVIIGVTTIGLLTSGHDANREKEVAALGIVTICCVGMALLMATLVSGVLKDSKKIFKKFEFVFAILSGLLVLAGGVLMLFSVLKERPGCVFGKTISRCQESFGLSVAGGSLAIVNCLVYAILAYYLIKKKL